ncbi:MAG: peptidoglycan DD-metalloendopeptidase family protein [Bacteroidales bacterium]|nr:peptidoglycan DD-metalloendopeptidase family protein [Bacteroidales bacterium]
MKRPAFILSVLMLLGCLAATAQDVSKQQGERDRLQKEIAILEAQIKENTAKSNNALTSLNLVQRQVKARRELVKRSDREIRVLDDSLHAMQHEINRAQERLDTMTLYYNRLIKNAYKNRDARVWYMYILASRNLNQATRRFAYLRGLSTQMNSQARHIQETRAELEQRRARLDSTRAEARALRAEHQAELSKLQQEEASSKKLVNQLNANKSRYQSQLNAKKKQVDALNRQIQQMINNAMGKGKTTTTRKTTSTEIDTKLANEFAANKGKLPWPAAGVVVEGFGQHNHPVYKNVKLPFNNGVNLAVDKGTEIRAVFDGVVKQIVVMPGYNQCVLVQHGSYFTFYCKLASVSVKAGQKITTGQVLGRIDTISGETQLHFQLWKNTDPQDPEQWLVR